MSPRLRYYSITLLFLLSLAAIVSAAILADHAPLVAGPLTGVAVAAVAAIAGLAPNGAQK